MAMRPKTNAIWIFGSKKALAEAMGIHRSLISKLPDELPTKCGNRSTGAAIQLGRWSRNNETHGGVAIPAWTRQDSRKAQDVWDPTSMTT